jgi:hypothetical protein
MKKTTARTSPQPQRPDLSALRRELPPYLSRKHPRFKELTGYSPRSFANMDSLKETASIGRIKIGGAVAYERESLISWLELHAEALS